jgi:hypothetical protein
MRHCRFCFKPLPYWYSNNIQYCLEIGCQQLSKNLRSNLFYYNLKEARKQINDNNIISILAKQNGLDVFIDWTILESMDFTWNSYSSIEVLNGLTVFILPSFIYAIFENKQIKIYKNETTN